MHKIRTLAVIRTRMNRDRDESQALRDITTGKQPTQWPQYSKMGKKKAAKIMKANKKQAEWPGLDYYPADRRAVANNVNANMLRKLNANAGRIEPGETT